MVELITEMLIYLGLSAVLGLVLGYLIWGWGAAARISEARADGAAAARTSVDGRAGLSEQLKEAQDERLRQSEEIDRLMDELAAAKQKGSDASDDGAEAEMPEVSTGSDPAEAVEPESNTVEPSADTEPVDLSRARPWHSATEQEAPEPEYKVADTIEAASDDAQMVQSEPTDAATADADNAASIIPVGLLSERPDDVDDLKKIKGVGKVMERVLNEKGIYLFRQLGSLEAQQVEWVNDAIDAFPGRIHRDRWVEQARRLYEEKYGEALEHEA